MMRRKLIFIAVILGLVSTGFAADYVTFTNGGGDNRWRNAANWIDGVLPVYKGAGQGDCVIHVSPNGPIFVDAQTAGVAEQINLGWNGPNPCLMTMSGGSLHACGSNSEFIVGIDTAGILSMCGGTITSDNNLRIGHGGDDSAKGWGTGIFNMTGNLTDTTVNTLNLYVGGWTSGSYGLLNLWGGTVNTANIYFNNWGAHAPGKDRIDLRNSPGVAQLVINDNLVSHPVYGDVIASWISAGYLTAYDGAGTVGYDYDVTNPGKTTAWGIPKPGSQEKLKGDLNNDGFVDFKDFSVLSENWLADIPHQ